MEGLDWPKNECKQDILRLVMSLMYEFYEDLMNGCEDISLKPSANQVESAWLYMHGMTPKHKLKRDFEIESGV